MTRSNSICILYIGILVKFTNNFDSFKVDYHSLERKREKEKRKKTALQDVMLLNSAVCKIFRVHTFQKKLLLVCFQNIWETSFIDVNAPLY